MVGDNHHVSDFEFGIHATSSIAHKKRLNAQFVHHSDWECHFAHVVALVEVKPALHGQDVLSTEFSEYEFPAMPFYRRNGEVRNRCIWEFVGVSYF